MKAWSCLALNHCWSIQLGEYCLLWLKVNLQSFRLKCFYHRLPENLQMEMPGIKAMTSLMKSKYTITELKPLWVYPSTQWCFLFLNEVQSPLLSHNWVELWWDKTKAFVGSVTMRRTKLVTLSGLPFTDKDSLEEENGCKTVKGISSHPRPLPYKTPPSTLMMMLYFASV